MIGNGRQLKKTGTFISTQEQLTEELFRLNLCLQKSYQAECFTPKRSLARTPLKKRQETENISPNVSQSPLPKDRKQNPTKDDKKKKVQTTSSTAKHVTLKKRNIHEELGNKEESSVSQIQSQMVR